VWLSHNIDTRHLVPSAASEERSGPAVEVNTRHQSHGPVEPSRRQWIRNPSAIALVESILYLITKHPDQVALLRRSNGPACLIERGCVGRGICWCRRRIGDKDTAGGKQAIVPGSRKIESSSRNSAPSKTLRSISPLNW